jgi:biopolymer transport protein TolR
MIMSRRARRMKRNHKRGRPMDSINLVSLMDILSILVFFLLFNPSPGEVLKAPRPVPPTESTYQPRPRETVVITASGTDMRVQGAIVNRIAQLHKYSAEDSTDLRATLEGQNHRTTVVLPVVLSDVREATIMGD